MDSNDLETRARHHDPGQELRGRVEGHAHQHRRHARPRRLRRRGRAGAVDGRQRAAAGRRGRRADAADPLRHQEGARARPEADRRRQQGRPARRARRTTSINATFDLFDKLGATEEQLDFPVDLRLGPERLGDAGEGRQSAPTWRRCSTPSSSTCRRTKASPTTRCSCRSARSTTPPTSAGSASAAINQGTLKPMQDVAVYCGPRRDADQGARQPGAEVRRPRAPAGDRGRPGRHRADQRHRRHRHRRDADRPRAAAAAADAAGRRADADDELLRQQLAARRPRRQVRHQPADPRPPRPRAAVERRAAR